MGIGVIPAMILCLFVLAMKKGRRYMIWILTHIIGIKINCGRVSFRVLPILTAINVMYTIVSLSKIHRLNKLIDDHTQKTHHDTTTSHLPELYLAYRNMLMNVTSIVCKLCLIVAIREYDNYQPISDKAKEIQAKK